MAKKRSPQSKQMLMQAKQNLNTALKDEFDDKMTSLISKLEPLGKGKHSLWKNCKGIKTPSQCDKPLRNFNGTWARSDSEKAEVFAHHLQGVFQPNPDQNGFLPPPITSIPLNCRLTFSFRTFYKEIRSLNMKKSPGEDRVSPKMIAELPLVAMKLLLYIFNGMLRLGYFPQTWKVSKIKMIAKQGKDPYQPTSYRPISLLSVTSKLFEKLMLKVFISPIMKSRNILPDHQFGFRECHSTIEQVNRITNEVRRAFEEKQYCSAIFLDVAQAFDKVWHTGLIFKLKQIFPEPIFNILNSYLCNRKFKIVQNEYLSGEYKINAGVPQGSVFGPTLYLIYTADLPTDNNVLTSTFADDTAILSRHRDPARASFILNSHLNKLQRWLANWRIVVNESKSTHITFTLCQKTCPIVFLNGTPIPQTTTVKYLGIHLDRRLTWLNHIKCKKQQLQLKFLELYWLLNYRSKLSIEHKTLIYKAILKPIWQYGAQLWCKASASNVALIQTSQSKILRSITNAPRFIKNEVIQKDLNLPPVHLEISKIRQKYLLKLATHPNNSAKNLLNINFDSRLKRNDFPTY